MKGWANAIVDVEMMQESLALKLDYSCCRHMEDCWNDQTECSQVTLTVIVRMEVVRTSQVYFDIDASSFPVALMFRLL